MYDWLDWASEWQDDTLAAVLLASLVMLAVALAALGDEVRR